MIYDLCWLHKKHLPYKIIFREFEELVVKGTFDFEGYKDAQRFRVVPE